MDELDMFILKRSLKGFYDWLAKIEKHLRMENDKYLYQ